MLLETLNAQGISENQTDNFLPFLKAQSQQAQNANDLINYSELAEVNKSRLTALTGIYDLPDNWFSNLPEIQMPELQNDLRDSIVNKRREILAAEKRVQIAQTGKRLAALNNRPDFTIGYSRAITGNRPDLGGAFLKDQGKDPQGLFIRMNLPVWKKTNRSRIKTARHNFDKRKAELKAEKDNAGAMLSRLWYQVQNRNRLFLIYQNQIIPQAAAAFESAHSVYLNDKSKFSDYLETANTYYSLRIAAARAEADLYADIAELEGFTETVFEISRPESKP